jgi:hypothetical protein
MGTSFVRTFWEENDRRCVLERVDGALELRLTEGARTTRLSTCRDLDDATRKAAEWRLNS